MASSPGQVLAASAAGVDIATGSGIIQATQLQKSGGKVMNAADFLRGFTVRPGMMFGDTAPAPADASPKID
jgi:methionyl-tRNA formyltransferase